MGRRRVALVAVVATTTQVADMAAVVGADRIDLVRLLKPGIGARDLVAKARATGVSAILSETSLPPRAAETIGREAGVKVVTGEDALYGDSLGPPGSDGDSYIRMIRHNTRTIVSNLNGT
jgi:ABC-type Zn uptake system ZnuABC Zn-binding protein ZnuA